MIHVQADTMRQTGTTSVSCPKPLSQDWLAWDPETIHRYPADTSEVLETEEPIEELAPVARNGARDCRQINRALLRDIVNGVATGVAAAILLALVIAFFPQASRANADTVKTTPLAGQSVEISGTRFQPTEQPGLIFEL